MRNAIVLLTGASSGFGKLIALTLAAEGHRVFAGMRAVTGRNAPAAAELSSVTAANPIVPIELDITSDDSVRSAVTRVLDSAGKIDVLINCAGVMWLGTTEAYSLEQMRSIMETNFFGPFRLFKAALPGMRSRNDGLLITISSVAGRMSPPGFSVYCATKSALESLAEGMGYEIAGLGIDSVIVEPGPFPTTNLMASQQDPAEQDIVAAYGEFGRLPEKMMAAAGTPDAATLAMMNPQIVADVVRDLVATPKGSRPVRQMVGIDFGMQGANDVQRRVQHEYLVALGLGDIDRPKPER